VGGGAEREIIALTVSIENNRFRASMLHAHTWPGGPSRLLIVVEEGSR
jgi:hypothetical protein